MSCEMKDDGSCNRAQYDDELYDDPVPNNELTASANDNGESKVNTSRPDHQKETVNMKNDLRDTATALGSNVFAEIAELSRYKFERAKAQQWAMKDICLLIYDDSDVKMDGFDSDDEEGQQEYALQMSLGDGDIPGSEGGDKAQRSDYGHDRSKRTCRVCAWYPEFPHKWKPRKFRVVNPVRDHPEWFKGDSIASFDICMHYVAVSYCWPPRDEKPIPRSYTVRDLDGRVRASRALDDVLDRVEDFANLGGLRMIWMNQECLPQPTEASPKADWDVQELGIQSMDIVYNRAMYTAGLLEVEITSQEQLKAIETLLYSSWETTQRVMNTQYCEHIIRFLQKTCEDRWYTRAWVIQEAICAGDKLMLAFRCNAGLNFSSKFRHGNQAEREERPYHSLDDHARGLSTSLVCIHVSQFWKILNVIRDLLIGDFLRMGSMLVRSSSLPAAEGYPGARSVLQAAELLHPRIVRANTIQQDHKIYGGGFYGKRPTINAAGALTLLKYRECYFESDRLAIVANMCDYDFRLDTKAISNNCHSLRLAILALALNNGDLSLLAPETYPPPNEIYTGDAYAGHVSSSLLFQSFFLEASRVENCQVRDFLNTRLETAIAGSVTPDGLLLKAYLWSVDREVDFTPIQSTWADDWESLRCWRMFVDRQGNETWEHFDARQAEITEWFSQPGVSDRALEGYRRFGYVPDDSAVWGSVDHSGVQMIRYIDCQRVKQVPQMQDLIAQIIFGILRYALIMSDEKVLARSLANSMWQSVRIDHVPGSDFPLPDEVGDDLFGHFDVLTRPFATLQLEETLDRTFAQLWFVDRILSKGKLWCGTYIPPARQDDSTTRFSSRSKSVLKEALATEKTFRRYRVQKHDSIVGKQVRRQLFLIRNLLSDSSAESPFSSSRWANVAFLEIATQQDYWSARGERQRKETLLSTFDVDGPCQVATPYNSQWEILPRPKSRSMRVCWVTEKRNGSGGAVIPIAGTEDTPHFEHPSGAEEKRKGRAFDLSREPEAFKNSGIPDATERFGNQGLNLQVLRKVKGLWQIMDLPSHDYIFS